jgi:hypothetical protein
MIDDRIESTIFRAEPVNLPPPRFDETAAARAQPVEPIPTVGASSLHTRAKTFRRLVAGSARALVLVVVAGLVTGTMAGMAWVKRSQSTWALPVDNSAVSEVAPSYVMRDGLRGDVSGTTSDDGAINSFNNLRRRPVRIRSSRSPRAYRVAVLR